MRSVICGKDDIEILICNTRSVSPVFFTPFVLSLYCKTCVRLKSSPSENGTVVRAGQLRNCGSIPGRRKRFSSPKWPGRLWGPSNLHVSRYLDRFARGCKADHFPSSNARLGMNGAISPLPMCLYGVHRDGYTFTDWLWFRECK